VVPVRSLKLEATSLSGVSLNSKSNCLLKTSAARDGSLVRGFADSGFVSCPAAVGASPHIRAATAAPITSIFTEGTGILRMIHISKLPPKN